MSSESPCIIYIIIILCIPIPSRPTRPTLDTIIDFKYCIYNQCILCNILCCNKIVAPSPPQILALDPVSKYTYVKYFNNQRRTHTYANINVLNCSQSDSQFNIYFIYIKRYSNKSTNDRRFRKHYFDSRISMFFHQKYFLVDKIVYNNIYYTVVHQA